jgi:hypothetical protein
MRLSFEMFNNGPKQVKNLLGGSPCLMPKDDLFVLILDGSRDPIKQMKAHKMRLKQPQNGVRLNLKPTPRTKGIELGKNIGKDDTCKDKTNRLAWEMRLIGR